MTVLDVNMRERPSEELLEALLAEAMKKKRSEDPPLVQAIKAVAENMGSFLAALGVGLNQQTILGCPRGLLSV